MNFLSITTKVKCWHVIYLYATKKELVLSDRKLPGVYPCIRESFHWRIHSRVEHINASWSYDANYRIVCKCKRFDVLILNHTHTQQMACASWNSAVKPRVCANRILLVNRTKLNSGCAISTTSFGGYDVLEICGLD